MKVSTWMTAGVLLAWGVVRLLGGPALGRDVGYGMLGPLAAAVGTWVVIERTAATDRAKLNQRLLQGFGVKVLFFAAYVATMLRVLLVTPLPFVASFTMSFLVLHATEAWLLQRLTARHLAAGAL